jgi:type I restriction enzyme M protein
MPNNLFYNTGITTYIWILSNNKAAHRKGKVQLIDAGQLYRKLRKNLGNKNCEFAPEHIHEILRVYVGMETVEIGEIGEIIEIREIKEINSTYTYNLASKVFDNQDFGYYKVSIERPKRLKAQFTEERIADLRFDKTLREPMAWAYEQFDNEVYTNLAKHEKAILDWAEKQELNLNAKQSRSLVSKETWQKQLDLLNVAKQLMKLVGTDEYSDFNLFREKVDGCCRDTACGVSTGEKNAILNVVSWYDATAEKVIKGTTKLSGEKLERLLNHLGCNENQLADYGYYATKKRGEYLEYETESDLRDTENVPLKENIHSYFLREVKPHVPEAWINLDATKIGYEISFNKYFYRHKPLRSIEEVSNDILKLEAESDGLIREILNFG